VCWREESGSKIYFRAEGIVSHILSDTYQGNTPEAAENRQEFGVPQLKRNQVKVITSDDECARAAGALAAALQLEHLRLGAAKRVAAAYVGRVVAIEIDEPGISTVHLVAHGRRVGGWSGP
jgi:hypothetical protein